MAGGGAPLLAAGGVGRDWPQPLKATKHVIKRMATSRFMLIFLQIGRGGAAPFCCPEYQAQVANDYGLPDWRRALRIGSALVATLEFVEQRKRLSGRERVGFNLRQLEFQLTDNGSRHRQ